MQVISSMSGKDEHQRRLVAQKASDVDGTPQRDPTQWDPPLPQWDPIQCDPSQWDPTSSPTAAPPDGDGTAPTVGPH